MTCEWCTCPSERHTTLENKQGITQWPGDVDDEDGKLIYLVVYFKGFSFE